MKEFSPTDFRFLGSPIDFVIFEGASNILDGQDKDLSITFCDIKTGAAKLTKLQQKIKNAVDNKRINWKTIYLKNE
jgi:predicted Holliday junction resolvase-like endonuclease